MSAIAECAWIALALIAAGLTALWSRVRGGDLVSAVGGLHINMLLFFGLGPLAYVSGYAQESILGSRVPYEELIESLTQACPFLLVGYLIAVALDARQRGFRILPPSALRNDNTVRITLGVMTVAIIGRIGSTYSFATSGVGTIFPVLRVLEYPAIALSIGFASRRNSSTFWLLSGFLVVESFLALVSWWRSDLLYLVAAVGLGLSLRKQRSVLPAIAGSLVAFFVFLPFVQAKKERYDDVMAKPLSSFIETLSVPFDERLALVVNLWAVRVNGARELAHVVHALEWNKIESRAGLTYWEALQQLVPRVVWPDKPSFNMTTNYFLARDIGLVGMDDEATSWGVSVFAEAVWNFGFIHLIWFVPAVFFLAGRVDRAIVARMRDPVCIAFVQAAFFFRFLDVPGFVPVMTYVLWLLVIGKALEVLLARIARTDTSRSGRARLAAPRFATRITPRS